MLGQPALPVSAWLEKLSLGYLLACGWLAAQQTSLISRVPKMVIVHHLRATKQEQRILSAGRLTAAFAFAVPDFSDDQQHLEL